MKKSLILGFLLVSVIGFSVKASEGCPVPDYKKIIRTTTSMNLNLLKEKADQGKMNETLALYDFQQQMKDPNYEISLSIITKIVERACFN